MLSNLSCVPALNIPAVSMTEWSGSVVHRGWCSSWGAFCHSTIFIWNRAPRIRIAYLGWPFFFFFQMLSEWAIWIGAIWSPLTRSHFFVTSKCTASILWKIQSWEKTGRKEREKRKEKKETVFLNRKIGLMAWPVLPFLLNFCSPCSHRRIRTNLFFVTQRV